MSALQLNRDVHVVASHARRVVKDPCVDVSGFALFCAGEAGAVHVIAHRMLDRARSDLGHRMLGRWLAGRSGAGREWAHLQWHVAVFELALGLWGDAFARFQAHLLPVAAAGDDARAVDKLASAVPHVAEIGGSRAQNELFERLAQERRRQAAARDPGAAYLKVA